jgi:predicted transcriptional regulator
MRQKKERRSKLMKISKLKAKIVEKEMRNEEFAKRLGIDISTLYRKFNKAEKITVGEALKMKQILDIKDEDAIEIFLR